MKHDYNQVYRVGLNVIRSRLRGVVALARVFFCVPDSLYSKIKSVYQGDGFVCCFFESTGLLKSLVFRRHQIKGIKRCRSQAHKIKISDNNQGILCLFITSTILLYVTSGLATLAHFVTI